MLISSPSGTNGLKVIHIPKKYLEVLVCIDASLAVNGDKSSQLDIVTIARDNKTGP